MDLVEMRRRALDSRKRRLDGSAVLSVTSQVRIVRLTELRDAIDDLGRMGLTLDQIQAQSEAHPDFLTTVYKTMPNPVPAFTDLSAIKAEIVASEVPAPAPAPAPVPSSISRVPEPKNRALPSLNSFPMLPLSSKSSHKFGSDRWSAHIGVLSDSDSEEDNSSEAENEQALERPQKILKENSSTPSADLVAVYRQQAASALAFVHQSLSTAASIIARLDRKDAWDAIEQVRRATREFEATVPQPPSQEQSDTGSGSQCDIQVMESDGIVATSSDRIVSSSVEQVDETMDIEGAGESQDTVRMVLDEQYQQQDAQDAQDAQDTQDEHSIQEGKLKKEIPVFSDENSSSDIEIVSEQRVSLNGVQLEKPYEHSMQDVEMIGNEADIKNLRLARRNARRKAAKKAQAESESSAQSEAPSRKELEERAAVAHIAPAEFEAHPETDMSIMNQDRDLAPAPEEYPEKDPEEDSKDPEEDPKRDLDEDVEAELESKSEVDLEVVLEPEPVAKSMAEPVPNPDHSQPNKPQTSVRYVSPLHRFRSFKFSPFYKDHLVSGTGFRSLTYAYKPVDVNKTLCVTETQGLNCHKDGCEFVHFRDFELDDKSILKEMSRAYVGGSAAEISRYRDDLLRIITSHDQQSFDELADSLVDHRRTVGPRVILDWHKFNKNKSDEKETLS